MFKRLRERSKAAIPAYRLFVTVFLWFWLTSLGAFTAIVFNHFQGRKVIHPRNTYAAVAPLLALGAIQAYEMGGPEAFRYYSQNRANNNDDRMLYLLDGSYKDVLGRNVTDEGMEVSRAAKEGQLLLLHNHIAAYRYTSPSGRPYVLLLYLGERGVSQIWHVISQEGVTFVLGLLLLITALCFWLTYHIASPIYGIQSAARRVTRGDLSARAPAKITRRYDELSALAIDFNLMVERIGVLLGSHKELLASVSHELRSPLARLSVSMALLRKGAGGRGEGLLNRMDRDIDLIDRLMGQLLTLSRFEAGVSQARQEVVDLGQLVQHIGADGDFEAAASDKSVNVVIRDQAILTAGDLYALRSALENIVRNAIRFTKANTAVTIVLSVHRSPMGDYAVVSVRDEGPGVPEELLVEIFNPFFRVHANAPASAGNGLGLAIASGAIQLHRGSITASNRPSGGLEVVVQLPLDELDMEATCRVCPEALAART